MKFDLHMHSNYSSDGQYTCEELLDIASGLGLRLIALSDHNTNAGLDKMIALGKQKGIQVIPAIEFDTRLNGRDVHLLGYNIDYKQEYFNNISAKIKKLSLDALSERVKKLEAKFKIDIDLAKCIELAGDGNPFFPIVESMLADPKAKDIEMLQPYLPNGSRSDLPVINFFWDCCGYGSDLFVSVDYPTFEKTVDIIHKAGGVAILAHPHSQFYQNEEMLQAAIDAKVDGLEAYSNYHDEAENLFFADFCRRNDLLITCGSDFHGMRKPHIKMGECGYYEDDEVVLKPFLEALYGKN